MDQIKIKIIQIVNFIIIILDTINDLNALQMQLKMNIQQEEKEYKNYDAKTKKALKIGETNQARQYAQVFFIYLYLGCFIS